MGKKKQKQQRREFPVAEQPGTGFGGLAAALVAGGLAKAKAPEPAAAPEPPPAPKKAPKEAKAPKVAPVATTPGPGTLLKGKAVVRQERKGHGGKTVTVIDGVAISRVDDLDALAKTVRKALGAGARVDGGTLVVQGDQREAASAWLTKQGASVVIGN